jgi:hypothetical protein
MAWEDVEKASYLDFDRVYLGVASWTDRLVVYESASEGA